MCPLGVGLLGVACLPLISPLFTLGLSADGQVESVTWQLRVARQQQGHGPFSPLLLCVSLGIHHASWGILIIWALGENGPHSLEQQIQGHAACPSCLGASDPAFPTGLACFL